jgi:aspartyl-tRNA synthetase
VRPRPEGNVNPTCRPAQVEVVASEIEVLNASAPLPFQIDERVTVGEEARLKYRYLDLRRPGTHNAARHPAALQGQRCRPRGARRPRLRRDRDPDADPLHARGRPRLPRARAAGPGSWYALPQSPQLFKQLLMVAGMERYYQIARCYRDEDFRADRQPEFTQLDIEMSFVEQDDVLALGEEIVRRSGRSSASTCPRRCRG